MSKDDGFSGRGGSRRYSVLVVGGGAREHAIVRALSRAQRPVEIFAAPGNPGIAEVATLANVSPDDRDGLVGLALELAPDLVVVGPEKPLTLGLADELRARNIAVFGPGIAAARLEGSKAFMKEFLGRHGIPTAPFRVFDDADEACAYVRGEGRPLVVKADGLAAGKGVVVAKDVAEAEAAVRSMMTERVFGDAGARVVIEDVLPGEEASFHVVCCVDAYRHQAIALAAAQDHKRVFDGDRGPNTGGMGAYAPAPIVTAAVHDKVMKTIVEPTLRGLSTEGLDYRGVLFVGLMIEDGEPRVLEFNVRFGDPEATVILPLYGGDMFELLSGAARGVLPEEVAPRTGAALSVVVAAEHYPATPTTGDEISGLDADVGPRAYVHHAGTRAGSGKTTTAGGRVLAVTGEGPTLREARDAAYAAVGRISFRGGHYRKDIGHRALS